MGHIEATRDLSAGPDALWGTVSELARDAKSLIIYAGSNEVQVTHIAKGLLAG